MAPPTDRHEREFPDLSLVALVRRGRPRRSRAVYNWGFSNPHQACAHTQV